MSENKPLSREAINKRLSAQGWSLERKATSGTGYLLHGPNGENHWAFRLVDVERLMGTLGL